MWDEQNPAVGEVHASGVVVVVLRSTYNVSICGFLTR